MLPLSSIQAALDRPPRFRLGSVPTPLEALPGMSRALKRPVFIKRDDTLGPAFGGNKARKLEYLIGAAQSSGMRRVATFGGLQSNHARMTAAAARMAGLEPHLLFFARRPRHLTGNLVVNAFFGAHVHFVPLGGSGGMPLERAIRLAHLVARVLVGRHYFIPVGGHSVLGCLGYVRAALELDAQARALGLGAAQVIVAAGTGGTLAGLMAGFALLGSPLTLRGIDVGALWRGFPASIATLASEITATLGAPQRFTANAAPLIEHRYVGAGYAVPLLEAERAARQLALVDGVVLDPIYTAKAFAGMLDLAQYGALGRDTPLIFLHTGGAPGFFA